MILLNSLHLAVSRVRKRYLGQVHVLKTPKKNVPERRFRTLDSRGVRKIAEIGKRTPYRGFVRIHGKPGQVIADKTSLSH
jgi:hypothetical protein